MRTVLVCPPHYYLGQTLGVPRLVAYLRGRGRDVVQRNVDAKIYDMLFSREYLTRCFVKIRCKTTTGAPDKHALSQQVAAFAALHGPQVYAGGLRGHLADLDSLLNKQRETIEAVAEAHAALREHWVMVGAESYERNLAVVKLGALIVSLAHHPTRLDLYNGISMRYSPHVAADILAATKDQEQNLLIDYYKQRLVSWIAEYDPGLVGVSIGHFSQMIPGFTLLSLVRESLPNTHLVVGGATATELAERLINSRPLAPLFDSLVKGFGEYALDELIGVLEANGNDLSGVPNIYYRQNGTVVQSAVCREVVLDHVVTPCYEDLRPRPVLAIQTSTGCEWGKCVFCRYPAHIDASPKEGRQLYRERALDLVVEDVRTLIVQHDPLFLTFADTSVTAKRLERLADRFLSDGIRVRFMCFVRAEKQFASLDFCRKLVDAGFCGGYFGLESACRRTNARMRKGVDLGTVEKMLANFSEVGIVPNMFCVLGFPGETREEALLTWDFIREHRSELTGEISVAPFYLVENSVIWDKPEDFGIRPLPSPYDFPKVHPFEVADGLSSDESLLMVKKIYEELKSVYLSDRFLLQMVRQQPV